MKRLIALFTLVLVGAVQVVSCGGGGGKGTEPISGEREVGPAGGTLTFANGVKLVFPSGAVDQRTVITVGDLPGAEIDEILANAVTGTTSTMRFLGGFSASPEGIVFKVPVHAWVPILHLNAYEIPISLSVRLNEGTYRYNSSTIEYDAGLKTVKLELQHFSDEAVAGLGPVLEQLCTKPRFRAPPKSARAGAARCVTTPPMGTERPTSRAQDRPPPYPQA